MTKEMKSYKYCICDGVLVVFTEHEGIAYFGEYEEIDEAEDALNELCEEGILYPDACLIEEHTNTVADLMKKFSFFKKRANV